MTGTVTALFDKGPYGSFGFIRDEEGHDRFFQPKNLLHDRAFGSIKKGAAVEFIPTNGGRGANGLRAENIEVK